LDHALADYDQAIALKPDYLAAYYNRGLALDDKGEHQRAVADFTLVLQADPNNPLVLYRRSQALLKKGDIEAAKADMAAARAIGRTSPRRSRVRSDSLASLRAVKTEYADGRRSPTQVRGRGCRPD
jgi:tetratricopeptide (TPR) repeat protein